MVTDAPARAAASAAEAPAGPAPRTRTSHSAARDPTCRPPVSHGIGSGRGDLLWHLHGPQRDYVVISADRPEVEMPDVVPRDVGDRARVRILLDAPEQRDERPVVHELSLRD